MSEKKLIIEIMPPKGLNQIANKEQIKTGVYNCPYCGGRGFFFDLVDDNKKEVCKVCEGKKRVYAEIEIFWKPYEK